MRVTSPNSMPVPLFRFSFSIDWNNNLDGEGCCGTQHLNCALLYYQSHNSIWCTAVGFIHFTPLFRGLVCLFRCSAGSFVSFSFYLLYYSYACNSTNYNQCDNARACYWICMLCCCCVHCLLSISFVWCVFVVCLFFLFVLLALSLRAWLFGVLL